LGREFPVLVAHAQGDARAFCLERAEQRFGLCRVQVAVAGGVFVVRFEGDVAVGLRRAVVHLQLQAEGFGRGAAVAHGQGNARADAAVRARFAGEEDGDGLRRVFAVLVSGGAAGAGVVAGEFPVAVVEVDAAVGEGDAGRGEEKGEEGGLHGVLRLWMVVDYCGFAEDYTDLPRPLPVRCRWAQE
jgi:hypothetical protein